MTKRTAISKRLRFEVFKRDSFKCQYCGRSAPDVILQVDHIVPVSEGGDNDMLNLITSCQSCNLGKSNIELNDDSAVIKRKNQADELQERREQMQMMIEWQMGLSEIEEMVVNEIEEFWYRLAPGYKFNEYGKNKLRSYIRKFELSEIISAMKDSASQYLKYSVDEEGNVKITSDSWNEAINKISGIIITKRKEKSDPNIKEIYYIRGILNNRLNYFNDRGYFTIVNKALNNGADIKDIKQIALDCINWTDFQVQINGLCKGDDDG
ncbi:MAG: HNH endonuclease domain protein [candidate division TA06 bacterium 34_109]|uniref:HNH endonuclease domain protein n=1 Tax=candidate division TA06 bacterium 34_109 TaxID=1635277 RepID=A0A117M5I7_UNCT6|nr:MAG: HNH endonuclease domain protein [candidate division TA06 bacterium 34_109]